jgi:hypothetical protein
VDALVRARACPAHVLTRRCCAAAQSFWRRMAWMWWT